MVGHRSDQQKVRLERLGRLVDRYVQSRSLPLAIPLGLEVTSVVFLIAAIELVMWKLAWWTLGLLVLAAVWAGIGALWATIRLLHRYKDSFYAKEGKIELPRERIPIRAWVVFIAVFLVAVFANDFGLANRWALTLALATMGVFVLYAGRKEKEQVLTDVLGVLLLVEAVVIAAGVPTPFAGRRWIYSFFAASAICWVGAGVVAMIIVHIYNRMILRQIKNARPFSEQRQDTADS